MRNNTVPIRVLLSIVFFYMLILNANSQRENSPIRFEPFIWKSNPPEDCPFERSKDISGILFTGTSSDYRMADT
jgi:hypothetical protein